ncbi:acyl-CoAN-acyltransferase [Moniliophthora roreri]|nr:acyl-CoAN-acyltransferase [Moniliophthora roreri]
MVEAALAASQAQLRTHSGQGKGTPTTYYTKHDAKALQDWQEKYFLPLFNTLCRQILSVNKTSLCLLTRFRKIKPGTSKEKNLILNKTEGYGPDITLHLEG